MVKEELDLLWGKTELGIGQNPESLIDHGLRGERLDAPRFPERHNATRHTTEKQCRHEHLCVDDHPDYFDLAHWIASCE